MLPVSKLVKNQTKKMQKIRGNKKVNVTLRYDDNCGNGHNSFAMTADLFEQSENGRWVDVGGGCCHDEIIKAFPKLSPLVKWHNVASDGPMHYVSNTMYHASDKDCWGTRKGEVRRYETAIRFENFPITFKLKQDFVKFLQGMKSYNFEVVQYDHDDNKTYSPKFTFGGYAKEWYQCPFDTQREALEFLDALLDYKPIFVKIPVSWGEGKEVDLEAAQSCAVWPTAKLEDFTKENLEARLPTLLNEFKTDMESLGFEY